MNRKIPKLCQLTLLLLSVALVLQLLLQVIFPILSYTICYGGLPSRHYATLILCHLYHPVGDDPYDMYVSTLSMVVVESLSEEMF